jgi:hypothetical protein
MSHIQDNDKTSLKTKYFEGWKPSQLQKSQLFGISVELSSKVKEKDNLGRTLLKESYKFEPEMWKH